MPYSQEDIVRILDNMKEGLAEASRLIEELRSQDKSRINSLQKCLEVLKAEEGKFLANNLEGDGDILYCESSDFSEIDHGDLIKEIEEALNPIQSTGTFFSYTTRYR